MRELSKREKKRDKAEKLTNLSFPCHNLGREREERKWKRKKRVLRKRMRKRE